MKRLSPFLCIVIKFVLILAVLALISLMTCTHAYADDDERDVVVIVMIPTPSPTPMTPPPQTPVPTPSPTPVVLPELPKYDYPSEDRRCLARGTWSVCPADPTPETKEAFNWLVLNRVDDDSGDFNDTPRWVLLQGNEFMDYDPDAYMSDENLAIADHVIRAWLYEKETGSTAYRLVPKDGLYCDFYDVHGRDYIVIYNRAGNIVYDSGAGIVN